MNTVPVSIEMVIDRRPLGVYRTVILAISFLIILMDGFDTQAVGFTAPAIANALHLPVAAFGQIFSAGLLGATVGAFVLGTLGDRTGRRRALVVSIFVFSAFSFFLPSASSFDQLLLCRFIAGLGLGGAIPNLLAICTEYTPRKMHNRLTGLLFAGAPAGGVAAAFVGVHVIPTHGWKAMFYIGGVAPLLLLIPVFLLFPEALHLLRRSNNGHSRIASIARRIGSNASIEHTVDPVDAHQCAPKASVGALFAEGRAVVTLLLWCASFMCFVILIVLALWTPALLRIKGVDAIGAALAVGFFNFGSVVGTAIGGKMLDRFGPFKVLPITFVAGAVSIVPLGYLGTTVSILAFFATFSGFFIGAGSAGVLGIAVLLYPSRLRASGLGWTVAVGRAGQVLSPIAIGALLFHGITVEHVFMLLVMPALCAAAAANLLRRHLSVVTPKAANDFLTL